MLGLCHSGSLGFLGGFGGMMGIGLILYLIFWIGLIGGLVLLAVTLTRRARMGAASASASYGRPTNGGRTVAGGNNTALEILQARYNRGEISDEQYELMKQDIT